MMDKKVKNFLQKWEGKEIEDWGSAVSRGFSEFQTEFKRLAGHLADGIAARLVSYRNGHYEMSGFLQRDDRFVYFRYSGNVHERLVPTLTDGAILIRRAASATDYTGQGNWFTSLEDFQRMADRLLR